MWEVQQNFLCFFINQITSKKHDHNIGAIPKEDITKNNNNKGFCQIL